MTSKKGTNHIYFLPKKQNQLIEIINYPTYSNKEDIGYEKLNELLNMKIINVEEIEKINHNNYNDKSLFYSQFIEIDQIYFLIIYHHLYYMHNHLIYFLLMFSYLIFLFLNYLLY